MDVLVTGATGFLGAALSEHLRARDHAVTAASRTPREGLIPVGDIGCETDWRPALKPGQVLVHCAGIAHMKASPRDYWRVNVAGTLRLARQAAEVGAARFIFISSIGVNGDRTHGRPFSAKDRPRPRGPYAESKLQAEDGLRRLAGATGLELVVIRPPLIVGLGAKANVALLAKAVRLGLPTPFGLVRNRRDVVSLSVLCRQIEACLTAPVAGRTFLAGDGEAVSTRRLIDRVADIQDLRRPLHLPVPVWLISITLPALGMAAQRVQLLGDLEVDSGPIRRLAGTDRAAGVREATT